MERRLFSYKGVTECCGAELTDIATDYTAAMPLFYTTIPAAVYDGVNVKAAKTPTIGKCAVCGKDITRNFAFSEEKWLAPPIHKLYTDEEKISVVITTRVYGMVKMFKRYSRKTDRGFEDAVARAADAIGQDRAERRVSYSYLEKSKLIFNARTGRTFQMTMHGSGKNKKKVLFDVSYNLDVTASVLTKLPADMRLEWLANCILRRIELCPHQEFEITEAAKSVTTEEDIRTLFIALRWPYLINTGLPLLGKPLAKYNRRVYRIMANEKSGTKLIKAMYPTYTKPVINFIKATGGYLTVQRMAAVFEPDQLAQLCGHPAVVAEFPEVPVRERFDNGDISKRVPFYAEMAVIGKRRMFNQFLDDFLERPTLSENMLSPLLSSLMLLTDACASLRQIRQCEGMESFVPGRQPTLKKMHDYLAKEYNKCMHANKVIPYEEHESKREIVIGNWRFSNAVDTHQLIDVGQTMHICVGGYGQRAAERATNIVIVTDVTTGNYAVCIEHNKGKLSQVKGFYDQILDDEGKDVVRRWADKVGLNWEDCFDMKAPKNENAWNLPQGHAEMFDPEEEFLGNMHVQAIPVDPIAVAMQPHLQPAPQFVPLPQQVRQQPGLLPNNFLAIRQDDDNVPF